MRHHELGVLVALEAGGREGVANVGNALATPQEWPPLTALGVHDLELEEHLEGIGPLPVLALTLKLTLALGLAVTPTKILLMLVENFMRTGSWRPTSLVGVGSGLIEMDNRE